MVVKVVDASAVAAIVFDEPEAERVAARIRGASLFAPALLDFELANIRWKKCVRRPAEADGIVQAFAERSAISIGEARVDLDQVAGLATVTGLTAYDASYLWLARDLGAELITLDRRLAAVFAEGRA
jgi:predicted nucleic acid-binding protein